MEFYASTQSELDHVVAIILERKIVAIDTEFTRETTYHPILSIIQIAVKDSDGVKKSYIIDCLIGLDLSGLFDIIADKKIVKILHSPLQDLQIFHRHSGFIPQNICDTQILASFCGLGFNIGYSSLVETMFKKKLNKGQQRSDWQRRPLSSGQVKYALLDVFYLEEAYEKLMTDLDEKNRLEWFLEEMQNFIDKLTVQSQENLLKKFSLRNKSNRQISQIECLISWREDWVRKLDIPRQHLVRDEKIEMLVSGEVATNRLGRRVNKDMISEIEKILDRDDFPERKKDPRADEQQKRIINKAKSLISKISTSEDLREQFLLTNADLKKIVCGEDDLTKILTGWRYELIGEEINNLMNT